ncbi:MAG: DNA polymerase IV [Rhodobacteraceae bacterium]|nr:DNA polymerase IV [Paracoccaceae bacterium]
MPNTTPALCRDCLHPFSGAGPCPACHSHRVVRHPELWQLSIAHMDCDAFYASVEKRDNPALRDLPIIVGGGQRGVVTTACYVARLYGVRSAMPMFQARKLCPQAVEVPIRMSVYVEASRQIRTLMDELTPIIEPLSLDEAFLDLTGTARLHKTPPAAQLVRLANRIQAEVGITISIGLSHNKFLAKIASDLDKPRGMALIGKAETTDFLKGKPVGMLSGVGPAMQQKLAQEGIRKIDDLLRYSAKDLADRFGGMGLRLYDLSRGQDARKINALAPVKSISRETTFNKDTADPEVLDGYLWRLCVETADRAKAKSLAGRVVVLKLKTSGFRQISRRLTLETPAQHADTIYTIARRLLEATLPQGPFRLLGVGITDLCPEDTANATTDLLDIDAPKRRAIEQATDSIRDKFGKDAIKKGRALK